LPRLLVCSRQPSTEIAAPAEQNFPHHWKFSKAYAGSRFAIDFKLPYIYDYITKLCKQQGEVIQNHENENVRNIGQGNPRHRKYKRLTLGGGQAYYDSSDLTAVVVGANNDKA
jgi:hypothetical protein